MAKRTRKPSWPEANQAFLVAEFVRLRNVLDAKYEPQDPDEVEKISATMEAPPAIDRLAQLFSLSSFERDILLLCAGVEMDSKLAAACGEAHGHPQRAHATFGLAMGALADPHWSALAPTRPLRRFRLVELDGAKGLTSALLRVDERILHYLAGVNLLDPRLEPILEVRPPPDLMADGHRGVAIRIADVLDAKMPPAIQFCGDDPQGQEDVAAIVAQAKGRQLLTVRADDLPAPGPDLNQLVTLWEREAPLLPAALLLQCAASGLSTGARQAAERLSAPFFLASREPVRLSRAIVRFDVDKPTPSDQKRLWQQALGPTAARLNGALDVLSGHFRLSARTIANTSALTAADPNALAANLWRACRSLARPRLEDLAQRIVPTAGWDDLIVPEPQKQMLRQLADQVRHRLKVYETWGFSDKDRRGLGISALFAGGSGTGKTLAAEVLARELALDLYRIDLSTVVSKYIGETEKNLRQVFDAAEEGGVLLLFDEADALFGKRSDVKDSHDRYANIEVGHLLQRMETYQGLAILTTNLKSALDKAFQRRLRFIVNFPFPDAAQREAIWERAFPPKTPTAGLEPKRLSQLNVAGGNIRNIALNAAFLAAAAEQPVAMTHVLEAARLEAHKIERPLTEAEIRGWV